MLAFSPPEILESLQGGDLRSYTTRTMTSVADLRRGLADVRVRHVAVARGELRRGVTAIAAPVFAGPTVAALELSSTAPADEVLALVPILRIAARGVARELRSADPTTGVAALEDPAAG